MSACEIEVHRSSVVNNGDVADAVDRNRQLLPEPCIPQIARRPLIVENAAGDASFDLTHPITSTLLVKFAVSHGPPQKLGLHSQVSHSLPCLPPVPCGACGGLSGLAVAY